MARRLIDHNAFTGCSTWHHYDHGTGKTWIETTQDVSRIIDNNKAQQNSGVNSRRGDYWKFATVPNNVIVQLKNECGIDVFNKDDLPKLEKLIERDPEWRYLRTY